MPRPAKRYGHLDKLDASDEIKRRMKLIIQTLDGSRTTKSAIAELGISESRFHQLRDDMLKGAAHGITPRPAGRPRKQPPSPEALRIQSLEEDLAAARQDLKVAEVRSSLEAVGLAELMQRPPQKNG